MPISQTEMAHILGLRSNPFVRWYHRFEENQGWFTDAGKNSVQNRYHELTGKELSLGLLSDFYDEHSKEESFSEKLKNFAQGDYFGLSTAWFAHAFSLHAIQDKENTHFVYVNRGRRHIQDKCMLARMDKDPTLLKEDELKKIFSGNPAYILFNNKIYFVDYQKQKVRPVYEPKMDDKDTIFNLFNPDDKIKEISGDAFEQIQKQTSTYIDRPAVLAFSIENAKAQEFASEIVKIFGTKNRTAISNFLNSNREKINWGLSNILTKSDQKAGNCTVANSNIAWHFQLASEYMKKNQTTFKEAYLATRMDYKKMRETDRFNAFKSLLSTKNRYPSSSAFYFDFMASIKKFVGKELKNKNFSLARASKDPLETEPNDLKELLCKQPGYILFDDTIYYVDKEGYAVHLKIDAENLNKLKTRFQDVKLTKLNKKDSEMTMGEQMAMGKTIPSYTLLSDGIWYFSSKGPKFTEFNSPSQYEEFIALFPEQENQEVSASSKQLDDISLFTKSNPTYQLATPEDLKEFRTLANHDIRKSDLLNRLTSDPEIKLDLFKLLTSAEYFQIMPTIVEALAKEEAGNNPAIEQDKKIKNEKNLTNTKDFILVELFKKFTVEEQKEKIQEDISLLKYAIPNIQQEFLNTDFQKYYLYASLSVQTTYQKPDAKFTKAAIEFSEKQLKTSGDRLLSNKSNIKEKELNEKLIAFNQSLMTGDNKIINESFNELCMICAKKRFRLGGAQYSAETSSMTWLIDKVKQNAELKTLLGVNNDDVKSRVIAAITTNNIAYKKKFQAGKPLPIAAEEPQIINENLIKKF